MTPAITRAIEDEGSAAVLRTFSPTGSDDYNDPTDPGESVEDTQALVEGLGQPTRIVTPAGEEVVVDVGVLIPDDVTVAPEEGELRPQIEVGKEAYKVWAVDREGPLDGAQMLLTTRFGLSNVAHTSEFTTEHA